MSIEVTYTGRQPGVPGEWHFVVRGRHDRLVAFGFRRSEELAREAAFTCREPWSPARIPPTADEVCPQQTTVVAQTRDGS